jgi:3-methyladenine DNA glycosylase AlkD
MTFDEAMRTLEKAGTEQNRKVPAKHGVEDAMFRVSFAVQRDLARYIRTNHALAMRLRDTGNHDARILATMFADATAAGKRQLEARSKQLDNCIITGALSARAATSPDARDRNGVDRF